MAERICVEPDCNKPTVAQRRCSGHYQRARRTGEIGLVAKKTLEESFASVQRRPGDYLKCRRVYEHRVVLLAVIGPDPHPCHWCNSMLQWNVDLQVDHVDFDRLNNDPHNLVPSCGRCNIARSRARRAAGQTHCKSGHEFTPENTYINATSGSRVCRTCASAYKREWSRKRLLLAAAKRPRSVA